MYLASAAMTMFSQMTHTGTRHQQKRACALWPCPPRIPPRHFPSPLIFKQMSFASSSLLEWAWVRHHNILSWYIRPLFLIPYCYAAHRHSFKGLILTVVGLLTSMAWFPAPANPSQAVRDALAAEEAYLSGPWGPGKVGMALLVPGTFAALARGFWVRSWAWGVMVLHAMFAIKVLWTFAMFNQGAARAHLLAAVTGFAVCDLVGAMMAVGYGWGKTGWGQQQGGGETRKKKK